MDLDDDAGVSLAFKSEGPPPTPETLTCQQALDIIDQHMNHADMHGPSRVNPSLRKFQALDILLRAIEACDPNELIASTPTRILLARNILKECGLAH
jgi:hypothetical protein